jgi:hypothetical protein
VNVRAYNDGANAIPEGWSLLATATDELHRRFPSALQIAEDLKEDSRLTRKVAEGGLGFDAEWDPAFFHPVNDAIIASTDAARSMWAIRDAIAHQHDGTGMRRVVYTESHDEVANGRKRIPEMIAPTDPGGYAARKRSTLGAGIALTSPGVPMLFMGMEFLERGSFADQRPLDWSKTTTYAGVLALSRDLIALRRNLGGTTRGLTGANVNVFHVNDGAKVIAYHRWKSGGPGDDVVVIANFGGRTFNAYDLGLPRAGTWRVRLNSDDKKYGADYAGTPTVDVASKPEPYDGFVQKGTLVVGPYIQPPRPLPRLGAVPRGTLTLDGRLRIDLTMAENAKTQRGRIPWRSPTVVTPESDPVHWRGGVPLSQEEGGDGEGAAADGEGVLVGGVAGGGREGEGGAAGAEVEEGDGAAGAGAGGGGEIVRAVVVERAGADPDGEAGERLRDGTAVCV